MSNMHKLCGAPMMSRRWRYLVALAALAPVSAAWGALAPEEIALVAARGSRESEALANYYARVRQVPARNICLVDLPRGETLDRETWRQSVRPAIQSWLAQNDPDERIRCLVTVWDVPLKIGPAAAADPATERYHTYLAAERAHRIRMLESIVEAFDQLANSGGGETGSGEEGSGEEGSGEEGSGEEGSGAAPGADAAAAVDDLAGLTSRLEAALQRAQAHVGGLPAGAERDQAAARLQQLATGAGGANVLLQGLTRQLQGAANPPAEARTQLDLLRGRATAYLEVRALLEQMAPGIERDALSLAMIERSAGLILSLQWLDEQLRIVDRNETGASFDSELSLVMWPDDYALLRWQPNYLRPAYDNSQLRAVQRTLMVARIDAPTLVLAKGLIDTAIRVEEEGLRGKVYIDARGLAELDDTPLPPGSFEDFDRALLATAKGIEERSTLEVVLDTRPQLFQPGDCPEAALYCGWYSLAKYVDAFEWVPGAVAYHLASGEARTLRDPASQAWCKRMLEEGVAATIGPVYEPYLTAFPRPNEFFGLLLEGELTLVECYYRTKPFNSWMMTLVGDPLYRPFGRHKPLADPPAGSGAAPAPGPLDADAGR